jgi:phage-related protein
MMVSIGADVSDFEKGSQTVKSEAKNMNSSISSMAKEMGTSVRGFGDKWRAMSQEMKDSYKVAKQSLLPFKQDILEVEYGFFKLGKSMNQYKGTNQQFMSEVVKLGKLHKQATDNMIKNNDLMKQKFVQNVGVLLARSGQSEKIADNFNRINNPLYKVNNGLLKVTGKLEGMAKKGTAAALSLKMLGPKANMKQLNDMTMTINRGLMRFTSVAVVASVGAAIFYGALHKGAKSVPGYTKSFDTMLSTVREAFQPMIEVFAAVMTKVYKFITYVSQLVIRFNEANPVLAKVIQGFLMLIPALILILSPLAIGIGLFGGFQAAMSAIWMIIGPLITGLGAMMGTVLLVAGVIALIGVALWALWTKTSWFKDSVLAVWNAIKKGTQTAWNWLMNSILKPIWKEIVSFGKEIFGKFQAFWAKHGDSIMKMVHAYIGFVKNNIQAGLKFIQGIFQIVFPIVSGVVKIAWNLIKTYIKTGIDIATGLISAGMALLKGDWDGAWNSIKGIAKDIWHNIESFFEDIDLMDIGKDIIRGLIKGIGSMAGAISDKVSSLASLVPKGLKSFLGIHSPSRVVEAIMKWVPIGAAEGIENNLGSVESATDKLSEASIPKLSEFNIGYKLQSKLDSNLSDNISSDRGQFENSKSKGIIQNITINSNTPLSPNEIKKKQLELSRQLAMEWGI